ncbi:DUF1707 SHOCT-like domain-containing protein [Corynebacterium propinquum]|uniref:DUF1707 SHOCT-like domain-containing protein n=1 Tax=Corynebacterium propinquum TaxID=43769 RepID=UPI0006699E45|nr:DUF1707 domain-containing protein [Corynebacterium propinquum]MCT1819489.1 DUF1707 domain-containing protein [Corynebacterium propinquum]MDK4234958.1 DUF1707 domain-containing protein [Corynebacterium propinquum]MDK4240050.1 DUF1707 domain-containing protein [Corynebacterium propinquum]MDK4257708.1 DUF1707 domain-containing protein [Corynebacterium propinquum]MDK4282324.1 DUF1707 domain-containing protein [Corynebacterium propinquum]
MSTPFNQSDASMRLSDADRDQAMNALGHALAEGRLQIDEFDDRCAAVAQAQYQRDLDQVFVDIPFTQQATGGSVEKYYSESQVQRAREAAKKPRLGTSILTSLAGMIAFPGFVALAFEAGSTGTAVLFGGLAMLSAFVVPAIWIALYVMQIGPDSWHRPSPAQLERQRRKEIRAAEASRRAEQKELTRQQWAERRHQAAELSGDAMNMAREQLNKWKNR